MLLPARWGYSSPFTSPLTGGGTLNVTVEYVRDFFSGNWSPSPEKIIVNPPPAGNFYNTGDFRINNTKGYANAAIFLTNGVNLYNINANNATVDLGELGGTTGAFIGMGSVSSSNPTWRIGAKNTTNTYAGVIADAGVTSVDQDRHRHADSCRDQHLQRRHHDQRRDVGGNQFRRQRHRHRRRGRK